MSHDHHGSPFIQHHYDDAKHQFESGKLGMWAFLAQEVLFFSALFVAYIVYRSHHPEIFYYAHKYLDVKWGATNTVVLLISSLSAAWAVRCAQLEQRRGLIACIVITILCACGFMGIKYVEYSHKIHDGILFGSKFAPKYDNHHNYFPTDKDGKPILKPSEDEAEQEAKEEGAQDPSGGAAPGAASPPSPAPGHGAAAAPANEAEVEAKDEAAAEAEAHGDHGGHGGGHGDAAVPPPAGTNMFFTIYFAMTGLHGIHVLVGILLFIWLLLRSIRGDFTKEYFGPIDYAALYWHLVDLIWIYLFPLLYLIH